MRLAHAAWEQSSLAPIARPFLDNLRKIVGEAVHLAQIDNGQVLFIDKRIRQRRIRHVGASRTSRARLLHRGRQSDVGVHGRRQRARALQQQAFMKYTAEPTTEPEALRSNLTASGATAMAYDREEHEPGIISIAAPILIRNDSVLGRCFGGDINRAT